MAANVCHQCSANIEEWNERCGGCGYTLVLEPEEKVRARYLRGPSLGAMLFTQGWTVGARLYLLFLLSIIPIVGVGVLVVCLLFGRRLSWKYGGWSDWEEFRSRMILLDVIGGIWLIGLLVAYFLARSQVGSVV